MPADKLRYKRAVQSGKAISFQADLLAVLYSSLHLHLDSFPLRSGNDRLVGILHVVLFDLAVILYAPLCEVVCRVGFLQPRIPLASQKSVMT